MKAGKRPKAEEATLTKALRQDSVWPFQGTASTELLVWGEGLSQKAFPKEVTLKLIPADGDGVIEESIPERERA